MSSFNLCSIVPVESNGAQNGGNGVRKGRNGAQNGGNGARKGRNGVQNGRNGARKGRSSCTLTKVRLPTTKRFTRWSKSLPSHGILASIFGDDDTSIAVDKNLLKDVLFTDEEMKQMEQMTCV
jgi:hypothetical protein